MKDRRDPRSAESRKENKFAHESEGLGTMGVYDCSSITCVYGLDQANAAPAQHKDLITIIRSC